MDAGLDSLGAVELRSRLNDEFAVQLPSTVVFDHPSVYALAEAVAGELSHGKSNYGSAQVLRNSTIDVTYSAQVCISSVSSPGQYQHALDDVSGVPENRWDIRADDYALIRFGRFLHNIEYFDIALFSMRRAEATAVDPQQRILLARALDGRAHAVNGQYSEGCGVVVGISSTDYSAITSRAGNLQATGGSLSVACGRISFTYNLRGTCASIDTACSSSLVGSHVARNAVLTGECDSMICCGVNITLNPTTTIVFRTAGMLADDGRCKTLDMAANGYVRGEGSTLLLLTPHSDGVRDDYCMFYASASSVNQDGRSSSLTAPHGPSQQSVILHTMLQSGNDNSSSGGIELHGTGTSLGDPIEVGAARTVLSSLKRLPVVTFSAMKTRCGHTEPASGGMGLCGIVDCIFRLNTPALVHLCQLSTHIQSILNQDTAERCGIALPRQATQSAWQCDAHAVNRGVSAFAFQGTNAHVSVRRDYVMKSLPDASVMQHSIECWISHAAFGLRLVHAVETSECLRIQLPPLKTRHIDRDHCVRGRLVLPATSFLELTLTCVKQLHTMTVNVVRRTQIHAACLLDTWRNDALSFKISQTTGSISVSSQRAGHTSCKVVQTMLTQRTPSPKVYYANVSKSSLDLHFKVHSKKVQTLDQSFAA